MSTLIGIIIQLVLIGVGVAKAHSMGKLVGREKQKVVDSKKGSEVIDDFIKKVSASRANPNVSLRVRNKARSVEAKRPRV